MNTVTRFDRCIAAAANRDARGGFSLLEVLVSLGILVSALAGIAAMLPAAASRVGDATALDRAGTLAANARADLANRGLLKATLCSGTAKGFTFGEIVPGISHATVASVNLGAGDIFVLDDDPSRGIRYGGMLVPLGVQPPATPQPGTSARLTTAVFRKAGAEIKQFTLDAVGAGVYRLPTTGPAADDDRKRFLAGCSWVVVVADGTEPRWCKIASSWSTLSGAAGTPTAAYVSLTGSGLPTGQLTVFGFDDLLLVDERIVVLE